MKQEIINSINLLAKEDTPFIFVVNYNGDDAYIRRLSEVNPKECLYDFERATRSMKTAKTPTSQQPRVDSHPQ